MATVKKEKTIKKLIATYEPEFSRVINFVWYGFVKQPDNSIVIVQVNLVKSGLGSSIWLDSPDADYETIWLEEKYETEASACYGLLLAIDDLDIKKS